MFFAEMMTARARFREAAARLPAVADERMLRGALEGGYADGIAEVMRAGAAGPAPAVPHLAVMRLLRPAQDDMTITMPVRWLAVAADGEMLPVLDADLTVTRDGDAGIRLRLAGSFRPPPWDGQLHGTPVSRRFAAAAVRSLLVRVTYVVTGAAPDQPPPGPGGPGGPGGPAGPPPPAGCPPGRARRRPGRQAGLSARPAACRFRAGT